MTWAWVAGVAPPPLALDAPRPAARRHRIVNASFNPKAPT